MGVPGTLDMEGEAGQVDGSRTLKRFVGPPGVLLPIPGLCSSQRQFLVFSFLPGLPVPKGSASFPPCPSCHLLLCVPHEEGGTP